MKIKPLSDHILIEPMKEEEKTKAGILLPATGKSILSLSTAGRSIGGTAVLAM
jgi:co-chaperonin GroES (HSP10)